MENKRKAKKGIVPKENQKLPGKDHDPSQSRSIDLQLPRRGRAHRHASSNFHQRNFEIVGFSNFFPEEEPDFKTPDLYTLEEEISSTDLHSDIPEPSAKQFLTEVAAQVESILQQDQEHLRLVTQKKKVIKTELYQCFFPKVQTKKETNEVYNLVRKSLMKMDTHNSESSTRNTKSVNFNHNL